MIPSMIMLPRACLRESLSVSLPACVSARDPAHESLLVSVAV
jgi:hypothetical protein